MSDFKWTKQLRNEFFDTLPDDIPVDLIERMEQFKASKTRKEWEVVAYSEIREGEKLIYKLQRTGRYRNEDWDCDIEYEAHQFREPQETIHSIRRLSDGLIVTVSERYRSTISGRYGTIKSIDNTGHVLFVAITETEHVSCLEKLPAPLFTTTDGKEILNGDLYYSIDDQWRITQYSADGEWVNYLDSTKNVFSTREAAEAYIVDNAPRLSVKDVRELLKVYFMPSSGQFLKDLSDIVKSKHNATGNKL